MKNRVPLFIAVCSGLLLNPTNEARAATTIDAVNHYAYGGNVGWLEARGDNSNGAVIGEYVCSGFMYLGNAGWVNFGSGSPTNGIYYQNLSANDFGVNCDALGNLRGYAWGANIGWINFAPAGGAKVDVITGKLGGYAWSANCGWITLSNAVAFVQTDTIQKGALAGNGLPIAWLLQNFGTTDVKADADADQDGLSNMQEYLAGTDPNNPASNLRITSFQRGSGGEPTRLEMVWTSVASRQYAIDLCKDVGANLWTDLILLPGLGANKAAWLDSSSGPLYRVRAFRTLTP